MSRVISGKLRLTSITLLLSPSTAGLYQEEGETWKMIANLPGPGESSTPEMKTEDVSKNKNEKWHRGVPPDFHCAWGISDVALRCVDEPEKLLHVNKAMLGVFFPFFKSLFCSDFAEKDKDVVDLDCEHEHLLDILLILHHVNRKFGNKSQQLFPPSSLVSLYRCADKYDIPLVLQLVMEQLADTKPSEAFEIAVQLEFLKEKAAIINRMIAIPELVKPPVMRGQAEKPKGKSYQFAAFLKNNPMTTFNFSSMPGLPWTGSDATLQITTPSGNRLLHVNKSVLASFSPFFRAVFFADSEDQLQNVVEVDVDCDIMIEILQVIFHVNRKFGLGNHKIYDIDMLKTMYEVATRFEIDVIHQLCKQQFLEVDPQKGLDVAIEFNLQEEKAIILENMTFKDASTFFRTNSKSQRPIFTGEEMNGDILCKIVEYFIDYISCPNCGCSNKRYNQINNSKCIITKPDTPFGTLFCTYCNNAFAFM